MISFLILSDKIYHCLDIKRVFWLQGPAIKYSYKKTTWSRMFFHSISWCLFVKSRNRRYIVINTPVLESFIINVNKVSRISLTLLVKESVYLLEHHLTHFIEANLYFILKLGLLNLEILLKTAFKTPSSFNLS